MIEKYNNDIDKNKDVKEIKAKIIDMTYNYEYTSTYAVFDLEPIKLNNCIKARIKVGINLHAMSTC